VVIFGLQSDVRDGAIGDAKVLFLKHFVRDGWSEVLLTRWDARRRDRRRFP